MFIKYMKVLTLIKIYEVLCTLRNKKLERNNILIEKYKNRLEKLDFEQDYNSRTPLGIQNVAHDSIRLMKKLAYYDRSFHKNINY